MTTALPPAVPVRPLALPSRRGGVGAFLGRVVIVLLPAGVLAFGIPHVPEDSQAQLAVGAGLIGFMGLLLLPQGRLGSTTTGLAVAALYVLAQVWLWFLKLPYHDHWYPHFAFAVLLAVPLLIVAAVSLINSGAHDLRRARLLVKQLLRRKDWPSDLSFCPTLPEVMELRDAVRADAAPALALLQDPRPEIRASALAALAYRKSWKAGQDAMVKRVAQSAREPAVRAAAVRALAFTRDREQVEVLAGFLRDRAPEVRRSATEVLFWESERRWAWVRYSVHDTLGDPALRDEGALPLAGVTLPEQALTDLHEWAGESGAQAVRAAQTLSAYYGHALSDRDEVLAAKLRRVVLNLHSPTMLRTELATLLIELKLIDPADEARLLTAENPTPLRLMAADALLSTGPHPQAVASLRDLARMPNREIALAVGQIVQRRLGVDLGFDLNKPPVPNTRKGAELTRRVMEWAADDREPDTNADLDSGAMPRPRPETQWDIDLPPKK